MSSPRPDRADTRCTGRAAGHPPGHAEVTALGVLGLADTLTRKIVADRIDVLREARSKR